MVRESVREFRVLVVGGFWRESLSVAHESRDSPASLVNQVEFPSNRNTNKGISTILATNSSLCGTKEIAATVG